MYIYIMIKVNTFRGNRGAISCFYVYKLWHVLHVSYLFNKAIHLFAPLNECIPMPVSIFKSISISHNE